MSVQRLFDEVRAAGYAGSYGRVRDYVRTVRPRDPAEPANRFETPPGRQCQVDFGSFTLPWGRRHALLVVLGHSRILWLRFYPRQTMAVLHGSGEPDHEDVVGRLPAVLQRACRYRQLLTAHETIMWPPSGPFGPNWSVKHGHAEAPCGKTWPIP